MEKKNQKFFIAKQFFTHITLDTSGTSLVFMYALQFLVYVFCILFCLHCILANFEISAFFDKCSFTNTPFPFKFFVS